MTLSIADDLRANIAHILERYTGKPFDSIAPVRVSHIKAMGDYIDRAEEAKASCTCAPVKVFNPYRKETRLDFDLKLARFKRMNAEAA